LITQLARLEPTTHIRLYVPKLEPNCNKLFSQSTKNVIKKKK